MSDVRVAAGEPPSIIGSVLGSYRITSELSTGGMGAVYRATHELLGRPAAVKLLRPELTANAELVTRFFNEAKAATAIRHPGIVEVFDFGYTDDGRAFLIMELLEGESLAARIASRGRLSEQDAAQITRGIASALTAAHGKNIVHRDLKPDNVFLVPDPDMPGGERATVLDFGIAKLIDPVGLPENHRHTATGALMGTPLYMAPEQARAAGEIDHRADLYSVGCMLYEMLVGEPPFVAQGAGEIIALQLFAEPEPPSKRLRTIAAPLEQIVMKLLAKEPEARFQTAAELSEALAGTLGQLTSRMATPLPLDTRPRPVVTARRTSFVAGTDPAGVALPLIVPTAIDDAAPRPPRSKLPLVAALITLGLAAIGAVVLLLAMRGDHAAAPAPAPAKLDTLPVQEAPAPAPTPPAPVPVIDTPVIAKDPPKPPAKEKPPHRTGQHKAGSATLPPCSPHATGDHTTNCSPIEDGKL